jgi:hypothetical protein
MAKVLIPVLTSQRKSKQCVIEKDLAHRQLTIRLGLKKSTAIRAIDFNQEFH